jgi:anaerobic selenocysteine-containing dehydrogenase
MTALTVRGACPHDCPDTCGVLTDVVDGHAVAFRGDPEHPSTRGWLCAKVRPYLDHVYHPGRLRHPLRRGGAKGSGQWQRITWAEALAEITERWQGIIRESGPEAILPYSYSGTLGLVQMVVSSGRFWNRLGASQLERSICGAAAEMAVEATLGRRWSGSYDDVLNSRLVILWGHNPISTAPHFLPPLRQAQRRGCRLVVIDPRRTRRRRRGRPAPRHPPRQRRRAGAGPGPPARRERLARRGMARAPHRRLAGAAPAAARVPARPRRARNGPVRRAGP